MAEIIGIKGYQFFELYIFHSEIVQEEGEDTLEDVSGVDREERHSRTRTASDSTVKMLALEVDGQRDIRTSIPTTTHFGYLLCFVMFKRLKL